MSDGIVRWKQMTGIPSEAMLGVKWTADVIGLRDTDDPDNANIDCPLEKCFRCFGSVRRAMTIRMPGAEPISVHLEASPVFGEERETLGAVIVIHDLSDRERLEKRLASLHEQTTQDALTNVANRGHLDDTLDAMIETAMKSHHTFSMIICDIDHFKRINDTYGHQAGDEALVKFADLLKTHCRDGDLVARYGGEEFVLLANSCDNATGAKRAEVIRSALEGVSMSCLAGESITASFGVTEFQSGDSAETIIARADRALLKAKDNGRKPRSTVRTRENVRVQRHQVLERLV